MLFSFGYLSRLSQNCDLTCLPHVRSSTPLATTSVGPPGTHAVGTRRFLQSRNRDSNRLSAQQSELTSGPFERLGARIARDKPLAKTPGQKLQRRQTTVPRRFGFCERERRARFEPPFGSANRIGMGLSHEARTVAAQGHGRRPCSTKQGHSFLWHRRPCGVWHA